MKKFTPLLMLILSLLFLTSCNSTQALSPTQNKTLHNLTRPAEKKEAGIMQRSLDNWLEKDWTPTVEKNAAIKKINENKERNFTLQEYVDKVAAYAGDDNETTNTSHSEEMNVLPAIGAH